MLKMAFAGRKSAECSRSHRLDGLYKTVGTNGAAEQPVPLLNRALAGEQKQP